MIELKTIAKTIENNLNTLLANDGGQQFKIFADLGEFQNYYKAQNSNDPTYYINGILEALTPSLLPIRNLQALTQTIRVTFALDVELMNKDTDGNFVEVTEIRKLLMKYIASANGIPFSLSETLTNNTTMTYEVTPSFNGVTVGEIAQLSPIGEILPMYLDLVYTFIQSGINSNSVQIFLNGESLYFEKCSLSRVRLAESNTFAGGKSTKTVIQNNGLSIDLNAPLLDTTQSGVIEDDVLDGGNNVAQCVQYVRGTKVRNYIMVFGNTTENLEMAKNIGANVSLVEGKQDILSYNEHWQTYSLTVGAGQTATIGTAVSEFKGVAFFGDGTSGTSTTGTFEHTYENAGTYIVRVFNLYNIKVVTFYVDDEVYENVEVDYGDLVERPEDPTKEGYTFDKWYANAELTIPFNFATTHITQNTEIYAGFDPILFTVQFIVDGVLDPSLTQHVQYTATNPSLTIDYWFTNSGLTELFDFNSQITQDMTLYSTVQDAGKLILNAQNCTIAVERTASALANASLVSLNNNDIVFKGDTLKYTITRASGDAIIYAVYNDYLQEEYLVATSNPYIDTVNFSIVRFEGDVVISAKAGTWTNVGNINIPFQQNSTSTSYDTVSSLDESAPSRLQGRFEYTEYDAGGASYMTFVEDLDIDFPSSNTWQNPVTWTSMNGHITIDFIANGKVFTTTTTADNQATALSMLSSINIKQIQ